MNAVAVSDRTNHLDVCMRSNVAAPAIVIVGSGPVGVHAAQKIAANLPDAPITLYGAEPRLPYNRVQLSSFLAGDVSSETLFKDSADLFELPIETRFGCKVTAIDRAAKLIVDAEGRRTPYQTLVLATGSRASWPNIDGLRCEGVFTFRDLDDAEKLSARRLRSRHTVIIGGGLLGLETARAMRRFNTKITVIEHSPWIMFNQLNAEAAACLSAQIERENITLVTGQSVKQVVGQPAVESVILSDGQQLHCDTVIVATGITPNVDLAKTSDLPFGRGIKVDEQMRTRDPAIFAIGECAEVHDTVYGLVAPGLAQAAVAASVIAGEEARFAEASPATTLKVLSVPVFSAGEVINSNKPIRPHAYQHGDTYRLVNVDRGKIAGVVAIGAWDELLRVQELLRKKARLWPWQRSRLERTGALMLDDSSANVTAWPASATICSCLNVSRGQIGAAINAGCQSVEAVSAQTRAASVCGSCKPLITEILGGAAEVQAAPGYWLTMLLSVVVFIAGAVALALPGLPYATSIQVVPDFNFLWTESFYKQFSGYVLLGLGILASLLSARKRLPEITWLQYPTWRSVHIGIGAILLVTLVAHTGFRLGANLNFFLISCFLAVALTGALSGVVISAEHRLSAGSAKFFRRLSIWSHVLVLWPFPLLLGFHIFKTYYF